VALLQMRQWGITYRTRQSHVVDEHQHVLSMGEYEAGRPSAEMACRFGDERFMAGQA
jgi:hydrogenase maturation protease